MSSMMSEYSRKGERWRAQDVRQLAVSAMVTERTVYRWLRAPERTHRGNRMRLEAAAQLLGMQLPGAAA